MQDRYLYRGKRTDNGEWVQGNLIIDEQNEKMCFIAYVFGTDEDGQPHDCDSALVDPSTICQCTGVHDKNGNLIWENDIMQAHLDDEFPEDVTRIRVLWHENGWCTNQYRCDDYEELDCADEKWFEVVGNMIDSPELWEVL